MSAYSIGVDLGGTNLRAAAVDREGRILQRHSMATPNYEGSREQIVTDIVGMIRELQGRVGAGELRGVGIGVPGYIQMETGIIVEAIIVNISSGLAFVPLARYPNQLPINSEQKIPPPSL